LTKQDNGLRTAGTRGELRTGIHYQEDTMADYTPVDPYEPSLARLRAATATSESLLADRYREHRAAEFAAEYKASALRGASVSGPRGQRPNRDYTPPDPYKAGLDKLRDAARTSVRTLARTPTEAPRDEHGIPDPYAAGLARMKENR
jgi:hypothetical protein